MCTELKKKTFLLAFVIQMITRDSGRELSQDTFWGERVKQLQT